jgi:putative ABC transport system substrate-binding protein
MSQSLLRTAWAAAFFLLALSSIASSQTSEKVRRVALLATTSSADAAMKRATQALVDDLRDLGWEEGRNLIIEQRFAGPNPARMSELAGELVDLKVDMIMAGNTQALSALRNKTSTIPIVMVGVADPVGSGLVASLARPGGNVTGVANQIETVSTKNLELLKTVKPEIKKVGIIFSPDNSPSVRTLKAMQGEVASSLGLIVLPIGVTSPEDLTEAFATILRERTEALLVLPVAVAFAHRAKIAEFAIEHRLPTMAPLDVLVRDGLLMGYGYESRATWRRAASYVHRILKGANPADLPVEQVDRFQLIINLKTARSMGLDATSLLSRADEVIE